MREIVKVIPQSEHRADDVITLMSLGCIVYFITLMGHEIVGHGSIMYLSGVRDFLLTSTSIDGSAQASQSPPWIDRLATMGGSIFNVAFAAALYPILLRARGYRSSGMTCYFLSLLVTVNLSLGLVYLLFSAIFGVGDWAVAIEGLPAPILYRTGEILIGLCGLFAAARIMAVSLGGFRGSPALLAIAPYLAAVAFFCTIGLRTPYSDLIFVSVFPAPILGQSALLLAPLLVRGRDERGPRNEGMSVPRSWTTITLAALCLLVTWYVAPGVRISL